MKNLLLLFAFLFTILGCSKDDDETNITPPQSQKIVVSKIEYFTPENILQTTTTLTYNSDNYLTKAKSISQNGFEVETIYTYLNGNIIKYISSDNQTNSPSIVEFTYSNNVLVSSKENNSITLYEYNSKGFLKAIKFPNSTINYTYDSNNNVINDSYATYEYDTKNDYQKNMTPENYYKIYRKSDYNVIKSVSGNETRTYEYKYLDNNYPYEITEKINGNIYEISKISYK